MTDCTQQPCTLNASISLKHKGLSCFGLWNFGLRVPLGIDTERLPCRTVLWAAGVKASSLGPGLDADLDRQGRVIVGPDLSLPDCHH